MNPSILAMLVSSLFIPIVGVLLRVLMQNNEVFTIMFFAGLINCICLWTILWFKEKKGAFRTSILHVHLIRGSLGAGGATSLVYSMKYVQVDLASTVIMSSPIWSTLLARFWIGEQTNWVTWMAICLGFCGILVSASPGIEGFNIWVLLLLVPAVVAALQNTMMTRFSGHGESPWKWSAYNEVVVLVSAFLLWIFLERSFVDKESVWLYILVPTVILPILFLVSYSFLNGKASIVAPLSYLQLPVAAVYGWLVFNETPETKTYYGAFLIILAGLILLLFSEKKVP